MEETQQRVKDAVDGLIDDLDKNSLRNMQKEMFICSSKCCEDKTNTRESIEKCVDYCNSGMKKAQNVLENELSMLQNDLSRCAMKCYDDARGQMQSGSSKKDELAITKGLDKCTAECANIHIALLPGIKARFLSNKF
ncbi:hypothetical protein L596_024147 [Steinernema carpocapsae]|nr:hypothetical protein L596_024147 [Steinernema carpocapsae]